MKKYKCAFCGWVYNPDIGDEKHGIPAGTAFEDLLDDWVCPGCGAEKEYFNPVD
jgi:rubredoxin